MHSAERAHARAPLPPVEGGWLGGATLPRVAREGRPLCVRVASRRAVRGRGRRVSHLLELGADLAELLPESHEESLPIDSLPLQRRPVAHLVLALRLEPVGPPQAERARYLGRLQVVGRLPQHRALLALLLPQVTPRRPAAHEALVHDAPPNLPPQQLDALLLLPRVARRLTLLDGARQLRP
eukprot:7189095-Prymnesium_polylepis.2